MRNIKQINIKNRAYYFLTDIINVKAFDSVLIKIDKNSHKNISIYNIGYITIKKTDDYESINSLNLLYLIIGKADGCMEERNGNKYLVFTSTDGNTKILAKFTKLWDQIKHFIETINKGKKDECEKDFMKFVIK